MATKKTKIDYFMELAVLAEGNEELQDFIDREINLLKNKAVKAKQRAEVKKAQGDALRDAIEAALTKEYLNIDEVIARLDYEGEFTRAQVASRISQLVRRGTAEKELTKYADGKKYMAYRLR